MDDFEDLWTKSSPPEVTETRAAIPAAAATAAPQGCTTGLLVDDGDVFFGPVTDRELLRIAYLNATNIPALMVKPVKKSEVFDVSSILRDEIKHGGLSVKALDSIKLGSHPIPAATAAPVVASSPLKVKGKPDVAGEVVRPEVKVAESKPEAPKPKSFLPVPTRIKVPPPFDSRDSIAMLNTIWCRHDRNPCRC